MEQPFSRAVGTTYIDTIYCAYPRKDVQLNSTVEILAHMATLCSSVCYSRNFTRFPVLQLTGVR